MRRLPAQRLRADERGATIVEFAIVLPVFVMMLMFMFDVGYYLYARAILSGEVQAAGRSSTMETATEANQALLDARVTYAVQKFVSGGSLSFQRTAYKSYGRAQAKAETFTDTNGDGICNNNESFDDANNNGIRDLDSGVNGQGDAKDVTIYNVTLDYDRIFPLAPLLGWSKHVQMTSTTILRNQPYDKQPQPAVGHCT